MECGSDRLKDNSENEDIYSASELCSNYNLNISDV
jgi:hypothetical protein